MSLSYGHPIKRVVRRALKLKPCGCGCNIVYVGQAVVDFSKLTRLEKWATRNPDGD